MRKTFTTAFLFSIVTMATTCLDGSTAITSEKKVDTPATALKKIVALQGEPQVNVTSNS